MAFTRDWDRDAREPSLSLAGAQLVEPGTDGLTATRAKAFYKSLPDSGRITSRRYERFTSTERSRRTQPY